jgi:hypothetical protein
MSIQHANRGIVKNNLQLYYNREYAKSFRGEATTNIAYVVNSFLNSNGNWWVNSGNTIFDDNDTSIPKPIISNVDTTNLRIFSSTVTAVGNQQLGSSIIPISPSTQYTMSIYYWFSGTSMQSQPYLRTNVNNNSLGNFAYNGDTNYLNWPRNTWIRLSITFTTPSNETGVYMSSYTGDNVGEKLAYFGYQLEQRAYTTLLVLGARAIATTNLLTATYSTLPTNWVVDGSGQGTIGSYSIIENGTTVRIVDVNSNTRFSVNTISGFSASTTYIFSVKYRKVSGTPTLRFQIAWYNSSNVFLSYVFPLTSEIKIYDLDGWQLAQYTATSPINTSKLTWFIQDGDDYTTYTHSYDLKEPQIQAGLGVSQWSATSYSANTLTGGGGLLDMSGNNYNIDLTSSAISFDSGGFYFNGNTAGALTTPVANSVLDGLSNNTHTYECWIKLLGTPPGSSDGYFFGRQGFHEGYAQFKSTPTAFGGLSWYYDNGNTGWLSYTGALNTWYHTAYVVDVENSIRYLYINGTLNSSGALTKQLKQYSSGTVYQLGSANPDYASNMIVSNAKAYNRALTVTEIQQNFNATRTTYGL